VSKFLFHLLANEVSLSRASDEMRKSWECSHNSQPSTCNVEQSMNICLITHSWKQYVSYARGSLYSD
jgi:hypothetical protein